MSEKKTRNSEKIIRELRAENRRLRAENYTLKEEIRASGGNAVLRSKGWQISLKQRAAKARLFSKNSYASYLLGVLRSRSIFAYYQRLVYIVRKYTFVTTTIKILTFLWAVLQSSALIVLFTGTMAVTIPITLIFSYIAIIFTFIFRKRLTQRTRHMLNDKKITVFFPSKGRAFERDSYFWKMLDDTANGEDSVAVIVSPYYFSPRGFSKSRKYYLAIRKERENVIIMRNHYFFTFKKKILSENSNNTTFIF